MATIVTTLKAQPARWYRLMWMSESPLRPATVGVKLRIRGQQVGTFLIGRKTPQRVATLLRWAKRMRKKGLPGKPGWAHGRS